MRSVSALALWALAGLGGALSPGRAAADPPAAARSLIDLWERAPGNYGSGADPAPRDLRRVDPGALPQSEARQQDVQYGAVVHVRGVPLRALLAQHPAAATATTALLRFRNGMVVPLPLRDERWQARLNPFLALAAEPAEGGGLRAGAFPPVSYRGADSDYADVRPIRFAGNKLVVSDRAHPAVPERHAAQFSPWGYVDSLAGVEFVDGAAYDRQFEPSAAAAPGAALFRESCQFCHGVRKVGARFGWDFVEPIPIYTYRHSGAKLYYHIRYRATERGQQMPALRHIAEDEAGKLLPWLRAVATEPMPPYRPAR